MSFQLDEIIPWGRTATEYRRMFDLSELDERGTILGCGDGPAGFNAVMSRQGQRVVSVDPLYVFAVESIEKRFEECVPRVIGQVRQNPKDYVWSYHANPDALLAHRREAMREFVVDFPEGVREGRYVAAALPCLPFSTQSFDLAVCSHLLFLYSGLLSFDFHLQSILELGRVAREVRIFPLTSLDCEPSPHLPVVLSALRESGFQCEVRRVNYQLQRNGDQMLRVFRSS